VDDGGGWHRTGHCGLCVVLQFEGIFYSNVMGEFAGGDIGCDHTDNQTVIAPGLSHAVVVLCHYC